MYKHTEIYQKNIEIMIFGPYRPPSTYDNKQRPNVYHKGHDASLDGHMNIVVVRLWHLFKHCSFMEVFFKLFLEQWG